MVEGGGAPPSDMLADGHLDMNPDGQAVASAAAVVPRPRAGGAKAPDSGYERLLRDYLSGQEQLREAETRFRLLVETIPGVAYIAEPAEHGEWYYLSPRLHELLGYDPEDWIASPTLWTTLLHPDDRDRVLDDEASWAEDAGGVHVAEYRLRDINGRYRWIRDAATARPGGRPGTPVVWFGVMTDVTESKDAQEALRESEQKLRALAFSDTLTGLPNRALLTERLDRALAAAGHRGGAGHDSQADHSDRSVALIFLDLDDFKSINDSLGHGLGDQVLVATAERLQAVCAAGQTVARFAGDEFAVLMPDVDGSDEVLALAERIAERLRTPVNLEGRMRSLTASIGIALAQPLGQGGEKGATSSMQMLRDADAAMYDAKRAGRDRCMLYDPVMHARALARQELKTDLESALAGAELFCVYQPYFETGGGRLAGFETLLRWQHPTRGLVSPLEFIRLAEESGQIRSIGAWVLRQACEQACAWPDPDGTSTRALSVSVNVSAVQLGDETFPATVEQVLHETELDARRLVLEITESVLLLGLREIVERLHRIRRLGVRVAIDDFGTGYSSLSYLQHLPLDVLKIDKTFVEGLTAAADDASMARVVVQIAKALQLTVIAEGVERPEQIEALRALRCDYTQGFLLGRPMPAEQALALALAHGGR